MRKAPIANKTALFANESFLITAILTIKNKTGINVIIIHPTGINISPSGLFTAPFNRLKATNNNPGKRYEIRKPYKPLQTDKIHSFILFIRNHDPVNKMYLYVLQSLSRYHSHSILGFPAAVKGM